MNARADSVRPFTITGRTVLAGMLAFFGVVIAVNGAFVFFALNSWPGLTTSRSYTEGLEYNRVLAAAEAQAARGWKAALAHKTADGQSTFDVVLQGHDDAPLSGLRVQVEAERPVGAEPARAIDLAESAPGVYRASIPRLGAGRWHVALHAAPAGAASPEASFFLRYEIVVRP